MQFQIHHYHHHCDPAIKAVLHSLTERIEDMANEIADLTAEIANNTSVTASAAALINGFKAQLDAAVAAATSGDLAPLKDLQTQLTANDTALAAAVAANTPAA